MHIRVPLPFIKGGKSGRTPMQMRTWDTPFRMDLSPSACAGVLGRIRSLWRSDTLLMHVHSWWQAAVMNNCASRVSCGAWGG